jgi:hypothetical protein
MMKNVKNIGLGVMAALLLAPSLQAAEGKAFLGGGLTFANDSLRKVTNNSLGLNVNGGWDYQLADSNTTFRMGLGLTILSGKEATYSYIYDPNNMYADVTTISKTTLYNVQGTLDLLIGTPSEKVKIITGLSVNQWRYQSASRFAAGSHNNDIVPTPHPYDLQGSKAPGNLKVGFRFGVDYQVNKAWSGEAVLQMVEFGAGDSESRFNSINPTWIQVGVKYHF